MNLFLGKIVDGFERGGEWFAVIEPKNRWWKNVIAPLKKGGEVIHLEDGSLWIDKGSMSCVPPNGTQVYYAFRRPTPGREFGTASVWCEAIAWDDADEDVRELALRLRMREAEDLMMPSHLQAPGPYRLGTRREGREVTESQFDPNDEERLLDWSPKPTTEWLGDTDIIVPIPVP